MSNEELREIERALAESRKTVLELEAKAEQLRQQARRLKLSEIAEQMKNAGITLDELSAFLGVTPSKGKSKSGTATTDPTKSRAKAKYFNPANPAETWSGVGRRVPEWIKQYLTSPEGVTPRTFDEKVIIK